MSTTAITNADAIEIRGGRGVDGAWQVNRLNSIFSRRIHVLSAAGLGRDERSGRNRTNTSVFPGASQVAIESGSFTAAEGYTANTTHIHNPFLVLNLSLAQDGVPDSLLVCTLILAFVALNITVGQVVLWGLILVVAVMLIIEACKTQGRSRRD